MRTKIFPMLVMGAALSLAGAAMADDSPSAQPIKSPKQKMQECMAQQRASNSAMSKQDLKKACDAKLQSDDNHPSRPQPSAPDSSNP